MPKKPNRLQSAYGKKHSAQQVACGQGIDQENLKQLFQPFFSTEINGTGLGLYLSQSICEANQAKLSYVERQQQGACFRIECQFIK